ncbi:hypothetical protein GpartN1_g7065.t1 [Galdieria partita]|uniref:Uncharacterized protein n=1 Tax=Galdieria partita TaxID=83374 RepID=A0A9C7Q3R4_9RHOD|nr:hypothetical protein GpartN1_g7065.t1 [Galdieria partita]
MSHPIPDKSQSRFRFKEETSLYIDKLFENIENDSVGCLSVCNETGVLAIVKGVQIVVTWLKSIHLTTDELREYKRLIFSKSVKNFGFAKKGNILFVQLQQEAKLFLYSVAALFQNKTTPIQVISLSSSPCKIWTIEEEEDHLYFSDYCQIERVHWSSLKHQVLFRLPEQVQELIFSPDGRKVATVTKEAKLQLWDENGKEIDHRILSLELPLLTFELFWNHTTTLFVMVHRTDGMLLVCCSLDTKAHIQHVNIYSSPFIETPCSVGNGISPFGMIQVVEEWQLFILGVSYSTDIQIIYKDKEQIYLLSLEEGEEISCPVDEQGRDTYPLSLALDWTNDMPVSSKGSSEKKLFAMPRLVLLLNNDMLKYYSVIDDHCTQPCTQIRKSVAPAVVNNCATASESSFSSNLSSQKQKYLSENSLKSHLSSHQSDPSTRLDINSVFDHLTNKMQQLFHGITEKQDSLDASLRQEILDSRMLRIEAIYQDCKVQCRKLLQQCDLFHKEWVEQVIENLEGCEKMRLEEERILNNAEKHSEIFLQDWIHPQWKEIEQQIQEKKTEIQQSIDYIQEFLEKVYRDRKAAHYGHETSVITQRKKIFQALYIQRKRFETLLKRFQELESSHLDKIQISNTNVLSSDYLKDQNYLESTNGKDAGTLMDSESLRKCCQLIYEMAMNNGRNEIRPQQQPLHFPQVKQISETDKKEKAMVLNQDQDWTTSSSLLSCSSSKEQLNSLFAADSLSLNLSSKTPVKEQKDKIPSSSITFNNTPCQTSLDEHQQPETTKIDIHANTSKDIIESKSSPLQYENSQLYQERKDQQEHSSLDSSLADNHLPKSSTNIDQRPEATLDEKSKDRKNEVLFTTSAVNPFSDKQHEKTIESEAKTVEFTEANNSNFATADQSVTRDLEAMDFSSDKQLESNTNTGSSRDSFQMKTAPFGEFLPATTAASIGSWNGFGSLSSTVSSFSSHNELTTTLDSSSQQNFVSNSGFSPGFGSSISHHPMSSPFVTNVSTSSSEYQFGSPSPFLPPFAGALNVSNVTPPTNRTAFGFGTSSSVGSNPFASLAQQATTSPLLASSNSFGSAPTSFTNPAASTSFTFNQPTNAAPSLPSSFSQMRK